MMHSQKYIKLNQDNYNSSDRQSVLMYGTTPNAKYFIVDNI